MTIPLVDEVLPLIRTRAELGRYSAANDHGGQMHDAIDILEARLDSVEPSEAFAVCQKALTSSLKVIMRADDSSGIIGDACRRLLELHPLLAEKAAIPPSRLVPWMLAFQFGNEVDFFEIDPVAYAPALGDRGLAAYRDALEAKQRTLGERPTASDRWQSPHSHDWFTLEWNEQRLAVLDRDVDAIIRTHVRDGRVEIWGLDAARALAEIQEFDLAIDWSRRAMEAGVQHQSIRAGTYWCELLAEHRPAALLTARLELFRRWPSSSTAAGLHAAAGGIWVDFHDEVLHTLEASPRDAVIFAQSTLKDIPLAWRLANELALSDARTWSDLLKAYEKVDSIATLPRHEDLVHADLVNANAQGYRNAARRLQRMRRIAVGTDEQPRVEALVAELRETHRRRPRLQLEFTRAGLP